MITYNDRDKSNPTLTSRQIELIQGSMLGDGCITKPKYELGNCSFKESHGWKQRKYAFWKFNELKPHSSRWSDESVCTSGFGKGKRIATLDTHVHSLLTDMERQWYLRDEFGNYVLRSNGWRIKIIPPNLVLTPFSAAVWYFDDGYINTEQRVVQIATNCFTTVECDHLVGQLNNLGIKHVFVRLKKRPSGKYQPTVEISPLSFIDFVEMVKPHMPHKCMAYKVDLSQYKPSMTLSERYAHNLKPWIEAGNMSEDKNPNSKLTKAKVKKIFVLARAGKTNTEIASLYGVSGANVSDILRGKFWKSAGETPLVIGTLQRNNTSGYIGVYFHKQQNKWEARYGKQNLGRFSSKEEAIKARKFAEGVVNV